MLSGDFKEHHPPDLRLPRITLDLGGGESPKGGTLEIIRLLHPPPVTQRELWCLPDLVLLHLTLQGSRMPVEWCHQQGLDVKGEPQAGHTEIRSARRPGDLGNYTQARGAAKPTRRAPSQYSQRSFRERIFLGPG